MIVNGNIFPGGGFADPHGMEVDGRVYLFCGRDKSYKTEDFCRMHKWTVISSDDLINWRKEFDILPTETYIGDQDNCWASDIIKKGDTFYWYFSNKNFDIGVMTSKSITGPFVDALGKPLIPQGLAPTSSYDPCIYEEDGVYTMFFGNGTYHCAILGDDMISLAEEPQAIRVQDADGNYVRMPDKSLVFKRGGHYYLVAGSKYAMSDKLRGPYLFKGYFVGGEHNDTFEFKGQRYLSYEFHDTNIYHRGVAVTELNFNEDGTVIVPSDDPCIRHETRTWDFTENDQYWFMTDGTDATHKDGAIHYDMNSYIGFRCPVFPGFKMNSDHTITIDMENENPDAIIKVMVDTTRKELGFAKDPDIYTKANLVELKSGRNTYEIKVECKADAEYIRCIRIFAKGPEDTGVLKIHSVTVSKD